MQLASMRLENQSYLLDGAGSLLFIPDLLAYFLTGEIHSEYTISSVSQMLDFHTGTWSPEILDVFGIPSRIFPRIVQPGTRVGKITEFSDCGAAKDIDVISVCEHDTASAFLAAPYGADAIIVSSGTWSLVGIETSSPIITDFTFRNNIANEGGYPGHHRLLKNVMGQWLLQECQRAYRESGNSYSIMDMMELARLAQPFQFLIDPDDERFFSPGHMPEKIVAFCSEKKQGSPVSTGEVVRCIIESLAIKYRLVIETLEAAVGRKYSVINIIGGGSNNDFLNQCVANVTGRRVLSGPEEATSLGNLLIQLIAAGELGSIAQGRELVAASFPVQAIEPQNQSEWETRYQQYITMMNVEEQTNVQ